METLSANKTLNFVEQPGVSHLVPALERLDVLLEHAVAAAQQIYGADTLTDRFRGLYVSHDEAVRLLAREAGAPLLWPHGAAETDIETDVTVPGSRLEWLQETYGLSPFDLDLLLIALAPDLDLRYERLYAYLQDHVARKRPTVGLALSLLCGNAADQLEQRGHFAAEAPLIRHDLIRLVPDASQVAPSLLAHFLTIDAQIVRFLLHQAGLDRRLASFCTLAEPEVALADLSLNTELKRALPALVTEARETNRPLRLYLAGPRGVGKRRTAAAVAAESGAPLLAVDLERARNTDADLTSLWTLVLRQAQFQDALLYLEGLDDLRTQAADAHRHLLDRLAAHNGIVFLAGAQEWPAADRHRLDVLSVSMPLPDFALRRACWQRELAAADVALEDGAVDALAGRYRLTPAQIARAVTDARQRSRWQAAARERRHPLGAHAPAPTRADLFAAARSQSGRDLAALAQPIEPLYTWDDIVLPADVRAQLREIGQRVAHRHRVLGDWGFQRKLSQGKGTNALFAGPSGTGKTMAAEVLANELGLELYRIDLSGVVSKYIGETEKNLNRIFRAAEDANAILFFDEADALFGKRSEVRDSHDRYANIEISYLLQQMESYAGLTILATNLRQNLDPAFTRRMAFTVHFSLPDEASRLRIWQGIWPAQTPLADDVDLAALARQFKLSGGNIKNVALAAAYLAAADGGAVTTEHLLHGVRREYQKMGRALSADALALNGTAG